MKARVTSDRRERPASIGKKPGPRRATSAEPITVDRAIELYPGEWIVMIVTGYDENHCISEGIVMAHSRSYKRADDIRWKLAGESDRPAGPVYLFEGYPPIRTGEEARRALAELLEHPERWPAWW
jgi:hypothetical protein